MGLGGNVSFAAKVLDDLHAFIEGNAEQIDSSPEFAARRAFWTRAVSALDSDSVAMLLTLKELNEERDALTGVLNRRGLERRLAEALDWAARTPEPVTLVFMDLDHFKTFNDTYGHQAGDAVLQSWVSFLLTSLRKTDVIGRFGGEEMVAVLIGATAQQGFLLLDRVREAMTEALRGSLEGLGIAIDVTMSVGVAEHVPGEAAADLLASADARLYEAKAAGRNIVIVGPGAPPP